jgi:succinate dehydrogenase/fumarate reductase flavoprotein subunit
MTNYECDLLCVGGGLGGLAAAVRAADLGLEVLILEKSSLIGGVAGYSGGVVWVGDNHLQQEVGLEDSAADVARYLGWAAGDGVAVDEKLRSTFIQRAAEAVAYFHSCGIAFQSTDLPDQYYPDAPGSKATGRILEVVTAGSALGQWRDYCRSSPHFRLVGLTHREIKEVGGDLVAGDALSALHRDRLKNDTLTWGPGLVAGFAVAGLVERGVPIELDARVTELLQVDGKVVGAVADVAGERVDIRTRRGVLIATGSYGNAPYAAMLEGLPEIFEASPPVLDGDGLDLTDPTPAGLVRSGQAFIILGFESHGERHPGTDVPFYRELSRALGLPHSIVVNKAGDRFGDESFYGYLLGAVKKYDNATKRFPNYPCFMIGDNRYRRRYGLGDLDEWPHGIAQSDDLTELAAMLDIDPEGLVQQVARFNESAENGTDPDFARGSLEYSRLRAGDPTQTPNPNVGSLREPPFWGLPLKLLGTGIYSMGLLINGDAQVLTRDRKPVPGLYATGNTVAYVEQPGYVGGLANARAITYSYLAAGHAAGCTAT